MHSHLTPSSIKSMEFFSSKCKTAAVKMPALVKRWI